MESVTEETTEPARSEIRKELEMWLTRNFEIENLMKAKGVNLSPLTFLSARLNYLIDTLIGPIEDDNNESLRIKWEVDIAKLTNRFLTDANQQVDAEIRKAQLVSGVGETAQKLHLPS